MVGRRSGAQGGVIRTYGRRRPVRRLQPQRWLSPADRKHLFSSSSSKSDTSNSDDSVFLPPERVVREKRRRPPPSKKPPPPSETPPPPLQKSPPFTRRRRKKKKCLQKKRHKSQSPSEPTSHDKENGPPPERSSSPPAIFTTPFKKHVTFRRKAPPPTVTMRPLSGRPKRNAVSPILYDSVCDFEESKRRRVRADVPGVMDSSTDTMLSPLQRKPLLSSTPSVQLTSMPRTSNAFVRQLALCEPLEESVVKSSSDADHEGEKREALSHADVTDRLMQGVTVILGNRREKSCVTAHWQSGHKKSPGSSSDFRASTNQASRNNLGSGVKCVRIKMSHGPSPLCVLSPVLSPGSPADICLSEQPGSRSKDDGRFPCVSPELFSSEDLPSHVGRHAGEPGRSGVGSLAGSPSASYLKGNSSDKWKHFSRKSLQPVVRLHPGAVGDYLQEQSTAKTPCEGTNNEKILPKNWNMSAPRDVPTGGTILPSPGLRRMQPVVCLDCRAVPKYFEEQKHEVPLERTTCGSPPSHSRLKTPPEATAAPTSRIQGSAATQEAGTGRKVCISGFSAKRWGNQRRKPARTPAHLSFQDYSDASLLMFREGVSACAVLSPSLLFSSSMLTSSFLNSTAVRDLNLSSDSLFLRDPQKEHQRWARLRAALSLHRKKKVEAGQPSSHPADQRKSMPGKHSSLLLLSPFQSSLCCEDLTDAEKVLAECQQEKPISFYQCLTLDQLHQCEKVGEGVYGEVFRTLRVDQHVALKVIPIEGLQKVNGEPQKSFAEILPEIIISKELSLLSGGNRNVTSGFIKLHSAYCVRGSYPAELLSAWDDFEEEKGTENERPDLFDAEQLFMILEFEFGGDDLERMSCKLPSVSASRSILHQVTAALAVAEEELRFEHRDLHWGNILIEKCSSLTLSASLQGETLNIPSAGVQVKIIDYTLSRLDKDGLTVFCDLSMDEELFLGEGDLQFDVYRQMREENQNGWSLYRPHSNVLWLHYLSDKLLREARYAKKPSSAAHQKELRKLRDFRKEVRQFRSATELLRQSKLFQ